MADETTSSTISELYTEIIAEAMFVANEKSLMRGLVKNYSISGGGKSVEVPIYAAVSAAAVSEAADLSNTFGAGSGATTDIGNEAMRSGFVGTVAGVPVYESANISNTGTTGDYKGAVFHRDALGLAMMQDLKLETQRDASLRADEIVATAVYGVAELNDTYGVELMMDSSLL